MGQMIAKHRAVSADEIALKTANCGWGVGSRFGECTETMMAFADSGDDCWLIESYKGEGMDEWSTIQAYQSYKQSIRCNGGKRFPDDVEAIMREGSLYICRRWVSTL